MVSHLSDKKEQAELRQTFNQFDLNGDGKIEKDEFIQAYKKVYPQMDPEQVKREATAFFDAADTDKNGSIDFMEWSAATINKRVLLNEKNLSATFEMFDKDGGGTISAQEIAQILGHNLSKDEKVWNDIVKEVDLNGDGLIDFIEFKTMMKKFTQTQK